jgi:hypothetical protein
MKDNTSASTGSSLGEAVPSMGTFNHKTIGIYPDFADVGAAFLLLNNEGFRNDQISVLGREQEHWQEKVGHEWETFKVTKAAVGGAALGAVPGLALITGIALTGGIGLLVVGPIVGAVSALGLGSLAGGLMGSNLTTFDIADSKLSVEQEVADAIGLGQWVIVVHTETEAEAMRARALMPNRRIVRDNESVPMESSVLADEQIDLNKLGKIVEDAFELVEKESTLPALEVMCKLDEIEVAALKQATDAAITKISYATDLDTAQITDIFKAYQIDGIDVIVHRLREQSRINRTPL